MKRGLEPIVDEHSTHLILGTLPGDESLRLGRYYANTRNQFWTILAQAFGDPLPQQYDERVSYLLRHRLALWDVLHSAHRPGSLDSAIGDAHPNNFSRLLKKYPALRSIGLNGTKAQSLFAKHIRPQLRAYSNHLTIVGLPSTSPTPGRNILPFESKVERWKAFLTSFDTNTGKPLRCRIARSSNENVALAQCANSPSPYK
jgi:hypoxanthine-DNA glycosylase